MELGTQIAPVNVTGAPAALGYRCDSRVVLQLGRRAEAFALGPQAGQQPRTQHRTGPGQAGKDFVVGMGRVSLGDLVLVAGNGLLDQLELAADQLHAQDEAFDQGPFIGDRHRLGDQGQALFQEFGAAGAVQVIERFERGGFGFLHGLEAGPFEQEAGGQRPPQVLAAQDQSLREVLF